jgi:protein-S-isoprenylcysteine O-methyltransferase Ste14
MLQKIGNFLFKYRTIVFPLFLPLALLPSPTLFDRPVIAAAIGFALAALGEAVRVSTIGMQYIVRGGRDRRVYAKDLVTGGFYAHTRNPMYVGNVLILVGLAVASNSWFCAVVLTAAYVFVCVAIVAAEESYLRDKFGAAFDEYCRDVPRWLPRMSGIGATLADYHFNWRRVVTKEYGTPLGWTLTWGVLVIWNLSRTAGGIDAHRTATAVVVGIVSIMLAFWITARIIKKSKKWAST